MNILGIGNLELVWILLLALVLLGPGRMVDAARAAGKFWREAQHVLRAAADAATVSLDAPPARRAPPEPLPEPEEVVARGSDTADERLNDGGDPAAPHFEGDGTDAQPDGIGGPPEAR